MIQVDIDVLRSLNGSGLSKEKFEYLQTLEGIRIMYYKDYLKEQNK